MQTIGLPLAFFNLIWALTSFSSATFENDDLLVTSLAVTPVAAHLRLRAWNWQLDVKKEKGQIGLERCSCLSAAQKLPRCDSSNQNEGLLSLRVKKYDSELNVCEGNEKAVVQEEHNSALGRKRACKSSESRSCLGCVLSRRKTPRHSNDKRPLHFRC